MMVQHRESFLTSGKSRAFSLLGFLCLLGLATGAPQSLAAPKTRLAVMVVFDQLRSSEMQRFDSLFGPGGFGGLKAQNAAWHEARYAYGNPETGPGHATLLTGANPVAHGICTNRWFENGAIQYSVQDNAHPTIGGKEGDGRSARFLMLPTLGDALKMHTQGRGKVFTISGKDRAAILSAGTSADLALWYDRNQGRFTSSTAYVNQLPQWAEELAIQLPKDSMATGQWEPLSLPASYEAKIPDDHRPGEEKPYGFQTTFPHHLKDLDSEKNKRHVYMGTPQGMADLFTLTTSAIENEHLGKDDAVDLLVISISTTDLIGHWYGPNSLEMLDILRRADKHIRSLHAYLQERVGKDHFYLAVTSDHGAAPLPETATGLGIPGGRIPVIPIRAALTELADKASQKKATITLHPPHVYVRWDEASKGERTKLVEEIKLYLQSIEGIAAIYQNTDAPSPKDPWAELMYQSICPNRSGDLLIRSEPNWIFAWEDKAGTDHGTPYLYDRAIPFMIVGHGLKRGQYVSPIDARDVAPSLAYLMGIPPPSGSQGKRIPSIKKQGGSFLP
jgi:predicted AlkP superfamily pyrophosphatase or phosphodiesterase